jgi:poly-beta-1,6-N-acetyl-D-glucosamine biosynthesis protein PgaD
MKQPIIENRRGADPLQRYGQGALTAAFWFGFGMLLRPLVTFAAWLMGGHFLHETVWTNEGLVSLARVPAMYVVVVFLIGAVLTGWASYNLLRFRNNERRTRQPQPVNPQEIAVFYRVSTEQVHRWQRAGRIVMAHDDQGFPVSARTQRESR